MSQKEEEVSSILESKYSVTIEFENGIYKIDNGSIIELYFIEDIFSYSITGQIQFVDVHGILELGPITGNEVINIFYGSKETQLHRSFLIYKVSNISQMSGARSENKSVCEILFVDYSFILFNNREYSYSWSDYYFSDIIKNLLEDFCEIKSFGHWDQCNEQLSYYSPWWNINQNITYLLPLMSNKKNNLGGYLMYSSTQGEEDSTFNLTNLESLFSQKDKLKVHKNDDSIYTFSSPNDYYVNKILTWNISSIDRTGINDLKGGTYYGYDINRKKMLLEKYTYTDLLNESTILGTHSLFNKIDDNSVIHNNTGFNDESLIKNIAYDNWIKRYSLQQLLTIVVYGHEKRYCGTMIDISWPSHFKSEKFNFNLGGLYLIKSITHYFNTKSTPVYKQKIVLMKNGYNFSKSEQLVKATKTNTNSHDFNALINKNY